MEIRLERSAGAVVVAPLGRIDSGSSEELEERLQDLLAGGDKRFVLDFAAVDYISSAGLRVLLLLAGKLRSGGALVLCGLGESVREVFDLAGFLPLFVVEPTRDLALSRLPPEGAS